MNPLFTDTVTLYRRNGEQYVRCVLRGVQWRQKVERANDDGKLSMVSVTSVTIPDGISEQIRPGDVLVLGVWPGIGEGYGIARLRAECETYCTVRTVTDNRLRPHLKHRRVTAV